MSLSFSVYLYLLYCVCALLRKAQTRVSQKKGDWGREEEKENAGVKAKKTKKKKK